MPLPQRHKNQMKCDMAFQTEDALKNIGYVSNLVPHRKKTPGLDLIKSDLSLSNCCKACDMSHNMGIKI